MGLSRTLQIAMKDVRSAAGVIASSSGRGQLSVGAMQLGRLGAGFFSENKSVRDTATTALRNGWRSMGKSNMYSGALMGAAAGGALQMGNNAVGGDNLFSGVVGASVRGAAFGGVAGAAYGMSRYAGNRISTPYTSARAWHPPMSGGVWHAPMMSPVNGGTRSTFAPDMHAFMKARAGAIRAGRK